MKNKEIMKLSAEEMSKTLAENRTKVREFRTAMSGGRVTNVHEAKNARRVIARILTAQAKA